MSIFDEQLWMMPGKSDNAFENALAKAAEKENAISIHKLHSLMQSAADEAAKEIKQRTFAREAIYNDTAEYIVPDATGLMRVVAKPIALSERKPDESEKDDSGRCYYGEWEGTSWIWIFGSLEGKWSTHFLPAGVEVLPATCFAPEEEKKAEKPKGKAPDAELLLEDWNIKIQKAELSCDPLQRKHYVYVWANIRRKDKRAFDSVVGKFIEIYRDGRLFEIEAEKIRHFIDADNLVSASADILCKISFYGHE